MERVKRCQLQVLFVSLFMTATETRNLGLRFSTNMDFETYVTLAKHELWETMRNSSCCFQKEESKDKAFLEIKHVRY